MERILETCNRDALANTELADSRHSYNEYQTISYYQLFLGIARIGSRIVSHETGVLGDDAVLRRQFDQFLDEFVVLSLEVELVDNLSRPAGSPQLRDKRVCIVLALFHKIGGEVEFFLFVPK